MILAATNRSQQTFQKQILSNPSNPSETADRYTPSRPNPMPTALKMAALAAIPGIGAVANAAGSLSTLMAHHPKQTALTALGAAANIAGAGCLVAYALTGSSSLVQAGLAGLGLSAAAGDTASYLTLSGRA